MTAALGLARGSDRAAPGSSLLAALNWGAAGVSILLPLLRIVANHTVNRGDWNYSAGDWLINYSQGFVRRGLVGEVVRRLPGLSDLVWTSAMVMALVTAAALLYAVLVQRTLARTSAPWPLLLWLLPTGPVLAQSMHLWQPYWIAGVQFPFRKEAYFYVVVGAAAVALTGRLGRTGRGVIVASAATGAALMVGALIHEGFVLMAGAATAVMALWAAARIGMPGVRRVVSLLLQGVPAAVGMALAVIARGDRLNVGAMWGAVDEGTRTWLESAAGGDFDRRIGVPGAFSYLLAPADDGIDRIRSLYLELGLWRWWLLSIVVATVCSAVVLLLCDTSPPGRRRLFTSGAAVAGAALPLFVVAFDWGRFTVATLMFVSIAAMAGIVGSPETPRPARTHLGILAAVVALLLLGAVIGIQETGNPQGALFAPAAAPDPG